MTENREQNEAAMRAGTIILTLVLLSVASTVSMSAEYPGSPSKHDIYRADARVLLAEQGDAQPDPRANDDSSESQKVAEWSRKKGRER